MQSAEIIDLAARLKPQTLARQRQLTKQAECTLKQLETTLGELALIGIEICGQDADAMDDDKVCRYMAFHTAGMLQAYAERNRRAQHTFEDNLRQKGLWPPK